MSEFHDISYNKSFSQLAKESRFTFNLYRGRVDWKKLEELDVDRVVRDQDVELLYLYINSVTNCSLESEYDVKILDPNFIKLFRLAQLLIDFLLHCKKYLEHCIKVAHESLQTSNKEVDMLRKQLQARKTEVKQLKKKFKGVKQQLLHSPGAAGPTFECSLCGKVFMSELYLHGHHSRRHQALPYSVVMQPFNMTPASPHVKCSLCGKVFMSELYLHGHHSRRHQALPYSVVMQPFNMTPASPHVKEIPSIAVLSGDAAVQQSPAASPHVKCSLCGKVFMSELYLHGHHSRRHQALPYSLVVQPFNMTPTSPHVKIVSYESEEKVLKTEEVSNIKKKYQEEIEDLKKLFFAEIEKLKHSDKVQKSTCASQTQYTKEEEEEKVIESEQHPGNPKEESNLRHVQIENENKNCRGDDERKIGDEDTDTKADVKSECINVKKTGVDSDELREGEWVKRLEEREAVWRARMSSLDRQHKKQVQQLQDKLNSTQLQGQEMKKELEYRLEEVIAKFEQSRKIAENKLKQSSQESDTKPTSKEVMKNQDRTNQMEIQTKEVIQRENPKQPPPFLKRKAFVSQKTKTVQDSFEIPNDEEPPENLVEVLKPDDDSELENVSILTQNSTRERGKTGAEDRTRVVNTNDRNEISQSKNKESIIAKLLEEERLRSLGDGKKHNDEGGEDSTLSGSVTETESESGEEEEEGGLHSSDDQDQLLHEESQLAQQSLQSMEALLAANPGILQQLQSDLAGLAGRRLHGLGVDPAWRGLPAATFRDKMATLMHQRNITAKNHPVYFTLRDKLRKDAESAVAVRSKAQPRSSAADSLLHRLRSKAAQFINAARFTRSLGSEKPPKLLPQQSISSLRGAKPLAASSPQLTPESTKVLSKNQEKNIPVITKVQSADESFSLSSSTEEEVKTKRNETFREALNSPNVEEMSRSGASHKEMAKTSIASPKADEASTSVASFKSALRHSVSTTNLTKKKVLFVDEAFTESKRSQSENTVITGRNAPSSKFSGSESVASLVQEIQQQLSNRSGKPSFSVDLMKQQNPPIKTLEIPLSELLPLTKSGRELLESPSKSRTVSSKSTFSEVYSPRTLEPLSQVLQKVPTTKSPSGSLGKKPDLLEWSSKSQLFPPKLSPDPSISSLGSSLLDISTSPRTPRKPARGSLEWDLQDLEDNMKD